MYERKLNNYNWRQHGKYEQTFETTEVDFNSPLRIKPRKTTKHPEQFAHLYAKLCSLESNILHIQKIVK